MIVKSTFNNVYLNNQKHIVIFTLTLVVLIFFCQGASGSQVEVTTTGSKTSRPGKLITHAFTVTNSGNNSDTYDLGLTTPSNWSVLGTLPNSISLAPSESKKYFATVVVPKTAVAKEYEIIFEASSQTNPAHAAESTAIVKIMAIPQLDSEWIREPSRAEPGGTSTGLLSIKNSGNVSDTYFIEVSSVNCEVELETKRVQVFPGDEKEIKLFLSLPTSLSPGSEYSFFLTISSQQHPDVTESLRHTSSAAPPPPEEVGGKIYPFWPITTTFYGDQDGDVSLEISGSGELEEIGTLSASATLTPTSLQEPEGSFLGENWGLDLGGGIISGGFGEVSSTNPTASFRSRNLEGFSTKVLFGQDIIGSSGRINWDGGSVRLVGGRESENSYSFQEIQLSSNFPGPFYITGGVGNAYSKSDSGQAFVLSPSIEGNIASITGNYLHVSSGFPGRLQETSYRLSLSFRGRVPLNLNGEVSQFISAETGEEIKTTTKTVSFNQILPFSEEAELEVSGEFEQEKSEDKPPTTNVFDWELASELTGAFGEENFYSLGLGLYETKNSVSGQNFLETEVSGDLGFTLGNFDLEFSLEIGQVLNKNTGKIESSSSTFATDLYFSKFEGDLDISMVVGEDPSLTVELGGPIQDQGQFEGSFTMPLSKEGIFSLSFSLTQPTLFVPCGPTKSRVKGKAFIDRNGNGVYDKGEKPVVDLLLSLTSFKEESGREEEAKTGKNGDFAFWPVKPGKYSLRLKDVPFGVEPLQGLPRVVRLEPGEKNFYLPFREYSAISGLVFDDSNQNEKLDPGEGGLSDIELLLSGPSESARVETDNSGRFSKKVEQGNYTITLLENSLPERFEPTTAKKLRVSIRPQDRKAVEFGTYKKPKDIVFTFGPPKAKIEYSPGEPRSGEEVIFDASKSQGVGDEITVYRWKFENDKKSFTKEGKSVKFEFPKTGEWLVTLTVEDEAEMKDEATINLEVR